MKAHRRFVSLTDHFSHHPQRFCKEAVLWKRLAHKNVLPFLGISKDVGEFCWISPWMKNGTILEYIRDNSQINTLELVCMNWQLCILLLLIYPDSLPPSSKMQLAD